MATSSTDASLIVLYDQPGRQKGDGKFSCYSGNVWKSRMLLNYKNLPYRTEWVDFPDLQETIAALAVEPNVNGSFTVPTVKLPDGSAVMDSLKIAEKIEELYPEPSAHLDAGLHQQVIDASMAAAMPIFGEVVLTAVQNCMTERSASWYRDVKAKQLGAGLEEVAVKHGGEAAWKTVMAPDGPLAKLRDTLTLNRRDQGPFVLGSQVSYGDFVAAALFETFARVDKAVYARLMSFDDCFIKLHQACRPWLQRDD